MGILIVSLFIAIGVQAYYLRKKNKQLKRYEGISSLEAETQRIQDEADSLKKSNEAQESALITLETKIATLKTELNLLEGIDSLGKENDRLRKDGRAIRDVIASLKKELGELEDEHEMQGFGLYRPKYDLGPSQNYKDKLAQIRKQQKELIKNNTAVIWDREWAVDGSKTKGKKMMKQHTQLTLRAFNGECDSIIDKVKYNNLETIRDRIQKVYEAINKINTSQNCKLSPKYIRLKNEELYLVHEYREKVAEEKEEQRQIREQMREEQRAIKEIEKAQKDAEKEEARYQTALEKARQEMNEATGQKHDKLKSEIERLNGMIEEAKKNKERAISQAQMTKSGHVYIISNVGSFGEGVYKIGMTRRLEPLDRVKELGDASVPFLFDIHAMIYSENAPELENHLHKVFEAHRINKVNHRKEFFRVGLNDIASKVNERIEDIQFTMVAEAEEYRKTQALLAEKQSEHHSISVYADVLDA